MTIAELIEQRDYFFDLAYTSSNTEAFVVVGGKKKYVHSGCSISDRHAYSIYTMIDNHIKNYDYKSKEVKEIKRAINYYSSRRGDWRAAHEKNK